MPQLRIATRRSALAMWQANHVRSLLQAHHPGLSVSLVPIVTRGDRILDRPLAKIGGKGLFLKELEVALLEGAADIAVHSMKDVPADLEAGLGLDVVLPRAPSADAWLCRTGEAPRDLAGGSRVGTSSLRRRSQLLALRPDLEVRDLRGNVDTRLRKLDEGEYEAIILARAGLERLGLADRITADFDAPEWLPAPAQGAIGIEGRTGDAATLERVLPLNDPDAALTTAMERRVAAVLGGSCQVPLAAHATLNGDRAEMAALVATPDGSRILRAQAEGVRADAISVAEDAADQLMEQGAGDIIAALST